MPSPTGAIGVRSRACSIGDAAVAASRGASCAPIPGWRSTDATSTPRRWPGARRTSPRGASRPSGRSRRPPMRTLSFHWSSATPSSPISTPTCSAPGSPRGSWRSSPREASSWLRSTAPSPRVSPSRSRRRNRAGGRGAGSARPTCWPPVSSTLERMSRCRDRPQQATTRGALPVARSDAPRLVRLFPRARDPRGRHAELPGPGHPRKAMTGVPRPRAGAGSPRR